MFTTHTKIDQESKKTWGGGGIDFLFYFIHLLTLFFFSNFVVCRISPRTVRRHSKYLRTYSQMKASAGSTDIQEYR